MAEVPPPPVSPVGGGGGIESGGDQSPQSNVREQDRFLPIANIGRIMKKALPANGKIAKDAKDTVQECVSEFISFITSEKFSPKQTSRASDKCQKEKRKTINGDDLLWAMATLGFEDYINPLKAYLARYRELESIDLTSLGLGVAGTTTMQLEGDTRVNARSGEGSANTVEAHLGPNSEFVRQGSFTQNLSANSQI